MLHRALVKVASVIVGLLLIGLMATHRSDPEELKRSESVDAVSPVTSPTAVAQATQMKRMRARQRTRPVPEASDMSALMAWLETEAAGRLRTEELAQYLAAKQRNAESLLTAFRTTFDQAFLREAVEKYPGDPQVNYTALFQSETPEERRRLLEAFKAGAPDNALANYLSAHDFFEAGRKEEALLELKLAAGKQSWDDYARAFIGASEEAFLAAGYSAIEAVATAETSLFPPHLAKLKGLGREMSELATLYQESGDGESATAIRQMGLALGQRYLESSSDGTVMKEIIGINIQSQILSTLEPGSAYDDSGRTVREEREALWQQRRSLTELSQRSLRVFPTLSERELSDYFARQKSVGELEAMKELVATHGRP